MKYKLALCSIAIILSGCGTVGNFVTADQNLKRKAAFALNTTPERVTISNRSGDLDSIQFVATVGKVPHQCYVTTLGGVINSDAVCSGVVSWNRRNFRHTTRISTCKFFDALDKVSERFVNVFQCLGFRALSTQRLLKTFQIGKPLPMQLI